ncbi:DUF1129 family protein [Lactobacillus sp.]|uniref:DUF1129 family protein n=1 Tax=Lactobacillus sp. TaxID=1591 RepID=UPI003F066ED9
MNARTKNLLSANSRQDSLRKRAEKTNKYEQLKRLPAKQLTEKLTKKNQKYLTSLKQALITEGKLGQTEAEDLTAPLLAKIVIAQEEGQTARRLFDLAPTDLARQLLQPKEENKAESKWPYFFVVCLAFLAMFSILAGVYESIAKGKLDPNRQIGWLTILVLALFMGWVVVRYKDLVKAGIKHSHLQLWSIMSLVMAGAIIWLLRLPVLKTVNPALPAPLCFIVAASAIVTLVLLMRHFKINHIFFEERRKQAKQ